MDSLCTFGLFKVSKYLRFYKLSYTLFFRNRDRPKSKQFDVIKALGDAAFSFKFEDSELLEGLIAGQTPETHPHMFTEHCWDVENRGAVGETTFHVCFLMGTPTHMYCAKRILKWFPKV